MFDDRMLEEYAQVYARDGAVMLRQPFASDWIDGLAAAFAEFVDPATAEKWPVGIMRKSNRVEITGAVGAHPFVRKWALESEAAEIVARVMGSTTARLYTDHDVGFGKLGEVEDALTGSSSFHIDASAWGLVGEQVPSFWLALSDVGEDLGPLVVAVGSHTRLPGLFLPSITDPTLEPPEGYLPYSEVQPFLDRNAFPMKTFPTMKGDVVLLHPKVVHGSIPLRKAGYRMGFSTRWLGDDVRWRLNTQTEIELAAARSTDRLDAAPVEGQPAQDELYPLIWQAGVGNLGSRPAAQDIHTLKTRSAPLSYTEYARVEPLRYTTRDGAV